MPLNLNVGTRQEDFYDYIRKCDFLSYAVVNGRIIGFDGCNHFLP